MASVSPAMTAAGKTAVGLLGPAAARAAPGIVKFREKWTVL